MMCVSNLNICHLAYQVLDSQCNHYLTTYRGSLLLIMIDINRNAFQHTKIYFNLLVLPEAAFSHSAVVLVVMDGGKSFAWISL